VSLWKHFNAASGAILAGTADFIDGLFHVRRMFGGSLPAAWPVVAPALRYADTFERDYAAAWQAVDRMIALLEDSGRFRVRKVANGTSRFFLSMPGGGAAALVDRAAALGVELPRPRADTGELALQVNPTVLRMPPEKLARILADASDG
jgi:threonine aldolase